MSAYSVSMEIRSVTTGPPPDTEWVELEPAAWCGDDLQPVSADHIRTWSLVLDAMEVPCKIDQTTDTWHIWVPHEQYQQAVTELYRYHKNNLDWPPPAPKVRAMAQNTLTTLSVLLLLATFHNLTLLDISLDGHTTIDWLKIGSARADLILSGEWWRTITALTLHANLPHLLGNLTIGGFIILWLCRDLGSGLAWSLLLASGLGGNLLNAWVQPGSHSSVGASTVVFGAVGLLAAFSLLRGNLSSRRGWGVPIAGGLAILAVLGTEGAQTDLGAHFFGFLCGFCCGLMTAMRVERAGRPAPIVSALLFLLTAALVIACWWLALQKNGLIPP